jgi:hypothetical protein
MASKKKTPAKKKAPPVAAETACSPSFVRMVIQVSNTQKNLEVMKRMYESARSFVGPVEGNLGVMKLETVTLEAWAKSRPIPLEND